MKLIGTKEKGYKLVSSFGKTKTEKPGKTENNTPPAGGTDGPDKDGKEE